MISMLVTFYFVMSAYFGW